MSLIQEPTIVQAHRKNTREIASATSKIVAMHAASFADALLDELKGEVLETVILPRDEYERLVYERDYWENAMKNDSPGHHEFLLSKLESENE